MPYSDATSFSGTQFAFKELLKYPSLKLKLLVD